MAGHTLTVRSPGKHRVDVHVRREDEVSQGSADDGGEDEVRLRTQNVNSSSDARTHGTHVVRHEDQHEEERQEDLCAV